mmetsp:Transcript_20219/g.28447  ORF Transcript_20219/g.28447 Transcript_20219/m.28447 type:complete len:190 (-) Transcript_20219:337-906(-)
MNRPLEAKVARWKRRALQSTSPSRRPMTQDCYPGKSTEGFQIFLTSPTGSQKCLVSTPSVELRSRKSRKRIRDDTQTESSLNSTSSTESKLLNAMRLENAFLEDGQDGDMKNIVDWGRPSLPLKGHVGLQTFSHATCLRRQLGTLDLSIPVFPSVKIPSPSLIMKSEQATKKRRFQPAMNIQGLKNFIK